MVASPSSSSSEKAHIYFDLNVKFRSDTVSYTQGRSPERKEIVTIANLHYVNGDLASIVHTPEGAPGATINAVESGTGNMVGIQIHPENIPSAAQALLMGLGRKLEIEEGRITAFTIEGTAVRTAIPKDEKMADYYLTEALSALAAYCVYMTSLEVELAEDLDTEALELRNVFHSYADESVDLVTIETSELNDWREVAKVARQLHARL